MTQVSKKIKILLYIVVVLLILELINVIILRPIVQKVEQSRTITEIEKREPIIVYVQILSDVKNQYFKTTYKKGELVTARANPDDLGCVFDYEYNRNSKTYLCFLQGSYKILSTDTEQELIKQAIGSEYGSAFYPDSTTSSFRDINQDGVKDAIIYQTSEPTSSIGIVDYTVYSATDNHILWGVSKTIHFDSLTSDQEEIKIISTRVNPDMIVIFEPKDLHKYKYNRYYFYKYHNGIYSQIKPDALDWKSYWKTVSIGNLFFRMMAFKLL